MVEERVVLINRGVDRREWLRRPGGSQGRKAAGERNFLHAEEPCRLENGKSVAHVVVEDNLIWKTVWRRNGTEMDNGFASLHRSCHLTDIAQVEFDEPRSVWQWLRLAPTVGADDAVSVRDEVV